MTAAAFKRPESVLVVIFTAAGEALLLKRSDHQAFWQSVTGSLEWGEHDRLAAARREVAEETGITTEDGWRDWGVHHQYEILPQWRYRYAPGVTHNTEHVLSVELPDRVAVRLHPREHEQYRWTDFHTAVKVATSATNRWAFTALAEARRFR